MSNVRFDEPELLIGPARDFREQVGGGRIANGCRLADSLSHRLAELCQRPGDNEYVPLLVGDAERIGDKEGALRRNLNGTGCGTAESAGPLGNKVGIFFDLCRDLVE